MFVLQHVQQGYFRPAPGLEEIGAHPAEERIRRVGQTSVTLPDGVTARLQILASVGVTPARQNSSHEFVWREVVFLLFPVKSRYALLDQDVGPRGRRNQHIRDGVFRRLL